MVQLVSKSDKRKKYVEQNWERNSVVLFAYCGETIRSAVATWDNLKRRVSRELKHGIRSDMDWVLKKVMEQSKKRVDDFIEKIEEQARATAVTTCEY